MRTEHTVNRDWCAPGAHEVPGGTEMNQTTRGWACPRHAKEGSMANVMTTAEVERRLLALGFVEDTGRKTSHRQFRKMGGLKVTLSGKERELSKKHLGMLRRQLASAGLAL